MEASREPLDDVLAEARRLIGTTDAAGLRVRVLGGGAFGLHIHGDLPDTLRRTYGDLDVAVTAQHAQRLARLLPELGYAPDERFNALHGERRFLFKDLAHDRKLDVFIGAFSMCHKMDLEGRLPAEGLTLQVTDLLLTKLQIVELNNKDARDVLGLLLEHDVCPAAAGDVVGLDRIGSVCGADWGWYTTIGDNLERLKEAAGRFLEPEAAAPVRARCEAIEAKLETCPKSLGWRMRARVGRRVEWYMLPEEVG